MSAFLQQVKEHTHKASGNVLVRRLLCLTIEVGSELSDNPSHRRKDKSLGSLFV